MKMSYQALFVLVLLTGILVNGCTKIVEEEKPTPEEEILNEFEKSSSVSVIVRFENSTTQEILSSIPISEYNLRGDLVDGFGMEITKQGFKELIKHPKVKMVHLDQKVSAHK